MGSFLGIIMSWFVHALVMLWKFSLHLRIWEGLVTPDWKIANRIVLNSVVWGREGYTNFDVGFFGGWLFWFGVGFLLGLGFFCTNFSVLSNWGKKTDSSKHLLKSALLHCVSLQVGRLLLQFSAAYFYFLSAIFPALFLKLFGISHFFSLFISFFSP